MDTRQLQALCAVIERASFSQAAEQLGVTQPAVSLAIRSLERRLGVTLIDRSGRHVEATEPGRVAYRHAQRVLAAESELVRSLADAAGSLEGQLILGASSDPGERVLPLLLSRFRHEHPEVSVSLRVDDTDTVIDRVLDRQVELGVVGAERPHRSLLFEPFLRDEIVLCTPPGHPFAGREVTLDELRNAPLVLQQEGAGTRLVVERELRSAGLRPRDLRVVAELGLSESTKTAVAAGVGVAFVSSLSIERDVADGVLATATVAGVQSRRLLYTVHLAHRPLSRVVREFLVYARTELRDRAATATDAPQRPVRGTRVG